MGRESFLVVLPARYASTRFPGKPLAEIAGRPLIEWVYRRAEEIRGVGELVVATDDDRIAGAVEGFGGRAVMTSADHVTGTDRVAEVARSRDLPFVVNLQGDEPVFDPRTVEEMVEQLSAAPDTDVVTACHPITSAKDYFDPNVVKVVVDRHGRALYFSRSPIPEGVFKNGAAVERPARVPEVQQAYRHVGVYAYRREALLRFASLAPTNLERTERLEQLRALENGMTVRVVVTDTPTLGVDVPENIKEVEKALGGIYTRRDATTGKPVKGIAREKPEPST
jgi:3-deoxy-manno-octulosonate cytidylyltransferase (CMP-KDO synthetase)